MSEAVLVFAEHQEGRLSRPTWEAMAAGQNLAQQLGGTVSAVLLGHQIAPLASELAALELEEVVCVDSPLLVRLHAGRLRRGAP